MSTVNEFASKLSSDNAFATKIKNSKTSADIVAVAKEAGINLTDSDIAKTIAKNSPDLSDAELESVTVGTPMAAALIK